MICSSTIELTLMRMLDGLAGERVAALLVDEPQKALAQVEGRDEQALELLLDRVAGQLVEEPGEVAADLVVDGEEAEVLVDAARLRVVVAGADVAVAAQHARLPRG